MVLLANERKIFPLEVPPYTAWVDIETRKVPAMKDFPTRMRWQVFLVGIAWDSRQDGGTWVEIYEIRDETRELEDLFEYVHDVGKVLRIRYSATREFDEMVLRGRFVNARAAHLARPLYPNIEDLNFSWENIRKIQKPTPVPPRDADDCLSKDVPQLWATGIEDHRRRVVHHCMVDVMELVKSDPKVKF